MDPVTTPIPAAPRRSYGRWIAAGLVLLVSPMIILGIAAWSMLTLSRDAAGLRREVMNATNSDWHTKVQMDVGPMTLGTARTVLSFVHHKNIADARLALSAVRSASVGVYERNRADEEVSFAKLSGHTDEFMRQRGWTRMVGVTSGRQNVLVYTSDRGSDDRMDLCLAVIDGKELVVVSTRVDPEVLMQLVEKHAPGGDLKSKLKLSKLNF
ncbi:MAG: hypothetical protein ABUL61_03775 [Oleiharenicola lentus]